jgi:DMSO/TMAO reductase YedYZ molybdopterin-dependent catalytic subunit
MATEPKPALTPQQELARRSRRSFLALGAGAVVAVGGWYWLNNEPLDDELPRTLRQALGFNEQVVRAALFSDGHLAKTFPASDIGKLKVNGEIGMDKPVDLAAWNLEVAPLGGAAMKLSMDDVRTLPRYEETIEFKCIEGWSVITQFAGARFSEFTARFAPGSDKAAHVSMNTPDKEYYVGVDMPSALHPQTLLAYEMNGQPLTDRHGAPLRLVIPVKYGIKNIKRIARIEYVETRPPDYWADEDGYDYYAGL